MTDLPEISVETVNVFLRAAVAAGAGAYISGGQGRLEVDDDHVRAGLAAALVASGYRREADVLREPVGYTSRGFAIYAEFIDTYGKQVRVTESSVATEDHCWIFAGGDAAHLNTEQARIVRDALTAWLLNGEPATALEPAQPLPVADGSKVCGNPTLRGVPCVLPADHSEPNIHHAEGQERSEEKECVRCGNVRAAVCCSSHGKRLCHLCYRRTHFVDVCAAGCSECAAEGLPVKLSDFGASRD